jgi:hypothetical protein
LNIKPKQEIQVNLLTFAKTKMISKFKSNKIKRMVVITLPQVSHKNKV